MKQKNSPPKDDIKSRVLQEEDFINENIEDLNNCECEINNDSADVNTESSNSDINSTINSETLGYLEMAQRLQADFDNYKRRNKDIEKNSFNNGVYALTEKLLPVLDSFKQAKETIKDKTTLSGLTIIHNQLLKALQSFGIKKIDCVGKEFDPNLHNAVLVENNPEFADGIVLEELQEGFKTANKIIRHSVVKVNKL